MTPREQAAFNAGIEMMRRTALAAAVTLTTRADGTGLRHQAAAAALVGLAEDAVDLMLGVEPEPSPIGLAFAAIAAEAGDTGTIACPACAGRLHWHRDSYNGHVHGQCETEGCLRWMQ